VISSKERPRASPIPVADTGRSRRVVLVGEAKWARRVNASALRIDLERKVQFLPRPADDPRYAICARERVDAAGDVLAVTAADIFSTAP
jgi:hypothetical protein